MNKYGNIVDIQLSQTFKTIHKYCIQIWHFLLWMNFFRNNHNFSSSNCTVFLSYIMFSASFSHPALFIYIYSAFVFSNVMLHTNSLIYSEAVTEKSHCFVTVKRWITHNWLYTLPGSSPSHKVISGTCVLSKLKIFKQLALINKSVT